MVAAATQTFREIEVLSPLGKDILLFQDMLVDEGLSQLTEIHLSVLSPNAEIKPEALLGQPIAIRLDLSGQQQRYFHGLVTHFQLTGTESRFAQYSITLQPWLWFLGLRSNCRVYQEQRVPNLLKALFREHGFSHFKDKLSKAYSTRRYCVQYRETDLHLIKRLMEQEGIYFYFEYTETAHYLVLADDISGHAVLPDSYAQIPFRPLAQRDHREEHISSWHLAYRAHAGQVTYKAFDFKQPQANLEARALRTTEHAHGKLELYDYVGDYYDYANGERLARIRMAAMQASYEQCRGRSNARGIAVGGLFTLLEHPRADQNREYLITRVTHRLHGDNFLSSGAAMGQPVYECEFHALDSRIPYQAPLQTAKPHMPGPETATVVGLKGQEIWTDLHGRIKVQFHWDREGQFDEQSSCWVRVSQPWAGKGWGTVAIPRIGQEVVVDFIQGDPDRPIIMGRVFNASQSPPYALPQAAHMMGFRSNSTPGGQGYSEMVIHDQSGEEKIILHSQKDMETTVLNNDHQTVKANRHITVEGQHQEQVRGEISITSTEQRIVLSAAQEIVLRVGASQIVLRDGTIDISGPVGVNINTDT